MDFNSENKSLYWDKYLYLKYKSIEKAKNKLGEILNNLNQMSKLSFSFIDERRNKIVNEFKERNMVIFDKNLTLKTRLLIGSGLPSITEVGITLSRNYGIPVIPASSIKGALAYYCETEKILSEKEYTIIFGSQDQKGDVIFLDAYPVGEVKFSIDIVNNHFQKYYMEGETPNDWYNPIPVTYITVGKGTFRFTVLAEEEIDENLRKKIENALFDMLRKYGIGAKTNYGYGRFN
ncbi:type III-B CRISPR module RAMP protein Cmr6 [Fervidobacterium sp. 2310opik-2]|uniref:type III-B CRISPR module RAMP protein Cmr6 n=1 Tax=Fervidobacterium sp. 2310opik-2 TaxID=1755815 RepID=UPI0013E02DBC|nr:type III-B CRISPR module RAMP protein Cmr6 [Fervidobacterium sp. 2310opik-2]KAF2961058.1 hypothetical protein AS161_03525 [Fervidobacterium sp. 2310opik-2]